MEYGAVSVAMHQDKHEQDESTSTPILLCRKMKAMMSSPRLKIREHLQNKGKTWRQHLYPVYPRYTHTERALTMVLTAISQSHADLRNTYEDLLQTNKVCID